MEPAPALSMPLNGKLYISVITRIETLAFPGITPAEESRIRELLTLLKVIPLNRKVERNAPFLSARKPNENSRTASSPQPPYPLARP